MGKNRKFCAGYGENAVNSQDFQKLNQTISNVVSSAADNITGNIMRQTKYAKQQREQQELALQKKKEKSNTVHQ